MNADIEALKKGLAVPNLPVDEASMHQRLLAELEAEVKAREAALVVRKYQQQETPAPLAPPVPKKADNSGCFVIIGLIAIVALVFFAKSHFDKPRQRTPEEEARLDSMALARTKATFDKIREDQLVGLSNKISGFNYQAHLGSSASALAAAMDLEEMSAMVKNAMADTSAQVRQDAKKWAAELKRKKVEALPALRRAWAKNAGSALWESDIDVAISGANSTILTLTGGAFAANKNKADAQNAINEALHALRFKQARYKWYSGDDEYTYYTIESPPDGEL